jgi:hypothetical protein
MPRSKAMIKKGVVVVGVLLVLLVVSYYILARGISYEITGYRKYSQQLDGNHLGKIESNFEYIYGTNPNDLRAFALNNTASELEFEMHRNALIDPNAILDRKTGHCKMYSYVLASTYNQLAKKCRSHSSCRVAYGHVYFYGINLHQFFTSSFFKDHDFCVIKDKNGVSAADAILFDYLSIDRVRLRR